MERIIHDGWQDLLERWKENRPSDDGEEIGRLQAVFYAGARTLYQRLQRAQSEEEVAGAWGAIAEELWQFRMTSLIFEQARRTPTGVPIS